MARVCIIGAGPSGFTALKALREAGIDTVCYEASDDIGGNWYYNNPNGQSACYQSLHIDTSKTKASFDDFPMPDHFPDFPGHQQIFQYFQDYVAHFGLRPHIQFNTWVTEVSEEGARWRVRTDQGDDSLFDYVLVANGHHWKPALPAYPGSFRGEVMHAHSYRNPTEPLDLRGKRVLVVGFGNSAMDIASELSPRFLTERLCVSARRGGYIMPKYLFGQPADKALLPPWVPGWLARRLFRWVYRFTVGDITRWGIQQPDHQPLEAHPSVSGEFLQRLGSGDIQMRPGIERFAGDEVVFTDGRREPFDVVIYATGYEISFPFLPEGLLPLKENRLPLFKRLLRPDHPTLIFLGLAQALPSLLNLAQVQMRLVVPLIQGRYQLPVPGEMARAIEVDEQTHGGHYYPSRRHTMQLDFALYERDVARELKRGMERLGRVG
ncbi:flavin-containing monooxygenase [Ferrimonas balearica]|uniref:flavin-containing monooxygenase n=1 Tax=Ferrimonas balearica TaxID=44012 RepID=UPI001C991156|nr:NAD(P)-binding domain-containing protein [Ferrimonas balearica]MBY5923435.1 NAD(P)-binding domain-containing protein [Ferrimonas balearica]MBY5995185.1 NAD(P)-binding domain-containing protein [Ferrimonas balearica]